MSLNLSCAFYSTMLPLHHRPIHSHRFALARSLRSCCMRSLQARGRSGVSDTRIQPRRSRKMDNYSWQKNPSIGLTSHAKNAPVKSNGMSGGALTRRGTKHSSLFVATAATGSPISQVKPQSNVSILFHRTLTQSSPAMFVRYAKRMEQRTITGRHTTCSAMMPTVGLSPFCA